MILIPVRIYTGSELVSFNTKAEVGMAKAKGIGLLT